MYQNSIRRCGVRTDCSWSSGVFCDGQSLTESAWSKTAAVFPSQSQSRMTLLGNRAQVIVTKKLLRGVVLEIKHFIKISQGGQRCIFITWFSHYIFTALAFFIVSAYGLNFMTALLPSQISPAFLASFEGDSTCRLTLQDLFFTLAGRFGFHTDLLHLQMSLTRSPSLRVGLAYSLILAASLNSHKLLIRVFPSSISLFTTDNF